MAKAEDCNSSIGGSNPLAVSIIEGKSMEKSNQIRCPKCGRIIDQKLIPDITYIGRCDGCKFDYKILNNKVLKGD